MKCIFTILVSFISIISIAQNYSGQYPGVMLFYSVNGSNSLTSIREDSSSINGNVLTRFPELLMRDVFSENIVDTNCMFWGAQECLFKKDAPTLLGNRIVSNNNSVKYFNFYGDSLSVRFDVSIGNTQTVFKDADTNLLVKYFCISKDTSTIFGIADSVMVFTVITTDSLSNLLTSTLSGDTIIYSKNVGLLKGFSFDNFPNTFSKIELKGIRNPNYGFYGLTYADVYDYQVEDKIELYIYSGYFYRNLYEVLNRVDNISDVTYNFKLITATAAFPPFNIFTYDTTFPSSSYSKINFIDDFYENSNYTLDFNILNGCISETLLSFTYSDYDYNYCPSAICYGSSDGFGGWMYSGQFASNVGHFSENDTQNGVSNSFVKGITYLDIQGLECGSSYLLSTSEIENNFNLSLFPNPTSNLITIQTNQIIQNGKILFADLSGRVVQQFNFDQSLQIDLSHFSNGIYLIKLFGDGNLLSVQKLVKE